MVPLQNLLEMGRLSPRTMNALALDRKDRMLNVIDSVLDLLQEDDFEANGKRTTKSIGI